MLRFIIFISLFIPELIFAEQKKVYYYTTENNINDFKTLKVSFDTYLKEFGDFTFQAFSEKETFEEYIKEENTIVILSSWHYKRIAKKYDIKAKLVALKKDSITDTKVIVGKKGALLDGTVTTAFSNEYAKELMDKLINKDDLNILTVPKEIDALMSVGFGMSSFALVTKDSFELLKEINGYLAKDMKIYKESKPIFRMLVASKQKENLKNHMIKIFTKMGLNNKGKEVLELLGVDDIVILSANEISELGGVR